MTRGGMAWYGGLTLVLGVLWATGGLAGDVPAGHPFSIDDVLKHEGLGAIKFDAQGRHGVIERIPPQDAIRDHMMYASVDRATMATLSVFDIDKPDQLRAIDIDKDAVGAWSGDFSPNGRRLVVFWLAQRALHAGVYDFDTRQVVKFAFTPSYTDSGGEHLWLSDDKVVFAAAPSGQFGHSQFLRARVSAWLTEAWAKTAAGREPSVTVFDGTPGAASAAPRTPGSLVLADAGSGGVTTVASGDFISLGISSDRRFVSAFRLGEFLPSTAEATLSAAGQRSSEATVFDFAHDGAETPLCHDCVAEVGTAEWSQNEPILVAFTRKASGSWHDGRFLRYDAARRSTTTIEHKGLDLVSERERFLLQRPERAVPAGDRFFVYARALATPDATPQYDTQRGVASAVRADWFAIDRSGKSQNLTSDFKQVSSIVLGANGNAIFVLADGKVWKVESDGKKTNLTESISAPLIPAPFSISTLAIRAPMSFTHSVLLAMGPTRSLVVVDFAEGKARVVPFPAAAGEISAYDPSGDLMIYRDGGMFAKSATGSTSLFFSRAGQAGQKLLEINQHYNNVLFGKQVQVAYTFQGTQLSACAILPPNWSEKKKYPVIVEVYPGVGRVNGASQCFSDNVSFYNPFNAQLWAARGYIYVLVPAPTKLIRTEQGPIDKMADVVLAGVDALIEKGYADPKRIGLYGLSQGGFAAPWILTRTTRFKAAIAAHGAVDYASEYGQVPLLRAVLSNDYFSAGDSVRYEEPSSDFFIGAPPWKDPQAYVRNSAVFSSDKIETPLMMINSDFDSFPANQYQEMFTALYRQHKDVELVTYWGEAHGVTSPANVRDEWARMYAWYDKYLK